MPSGCTYILGSLSGTLYIGVTSDIDVRLAEHRNGSTPGFASQYGCRRLLYLEHFDDISNAISREKQLKGWRREKKLRLIRKSNPEFRDLAELWGCLHIGPFKSMAEFDYELANRIQPYKR
jgi:putative endonuclease